MSEKQHYNEARKAEKSGNLDLAVELYGQALKENPAFRPALMNLGAVFGRLRRPEKSVVYYEAALRLGADEAVHFNLGSEYYQLKQYEKSAAHLIASLKINPRFLRAHVLLAYVYEARKLPEKSELYFRNALKIEPGSRIAVLGLLLNLSRQDKHAEALQICERFLKHSPSDETVQAMRAGLLLETGDYQASTEELQRLGRENQGYRGFADHIQKARESREGESSEFFAGIRERIQERSSSLRARVEERKRAREAGKSRPTVDAGDDAKDMVDLSLMYLFSGETDKAMQFLVQARKIKDRSGQ
jgi:tetratricopeptide (TPR) repeat protein